MPGFVFTSGESKVVVVFVHGIFGDARETWRGDDGYFWDLLKGQPGFKDAKFYAYGFPSKLWGAGFDIEEASVSLTATLYKLQAEYTEIRIIAHSMGGIVAINTLTLYPELSSNVTMIFALGSPFEGAGIAEIGDLLLGNPGLRDLVIENHFLKKTEDEWRGLKDRQSTRTKVYCAYETLPYGAWFFGSVIVPRLSATRWCDGISYAVTGDHLEIVKPNQNRLDAIDAVVDAYRRIEKQDKGNTGSAMKQQPPAISKPQKGSPAWPYYEAKEHLTDPTKLTLHDLFMTDFQDGNQTIEDRRTLVSPSGRAVVVERRVVLDLQGGTKLIQFYIPVWHDTYNVCAVISDDHDTLLREADEFTITSKGIGDSTVTSSKDLRFTGRIFIYHETELTAEQIGDLTKIYRSKGVYVQLRSSTYLSFRKMQTTIDKTK